MRISDEFYVKYIYLVVLQKTIILRWVLAAGKLTKSSRELVLTSQINSLRSGVLIKKLYSIVGITYRTVQETTLQRPIAIGEKIDDQEILTHIALHDKAYWVRVVAAEKLDDQKTLMEALL